MKNPFIEPFRSIVNTYRATNDLHQLKRSIQHYWDEEERTSKLRSLGRNLVALNRVSTSGFGTTANGRNVFENVRMRIGEMISGKTGPTISSRGVPGTNDLQSQMNQLQANQGMYGPWRPRTEGKARKGRKSRIKKQYKTLSDNKL